jgi:predicted DCC family thiol-disulfide oxidoreductase YuxK
MAIAVVYDADCGVCQASVAWAKQRDRRGALQFVGNDAGELPPGVSREETEHTVVVIDGARKLVRADGVARVLRELRGWSVLGAVLRVPGIRQIANVGYGAFARRRHRVSAALGMRACEVRVPGQGKGKGKGTDAVGAQADEGVGQPSPRT